MKKIMFFVIGILICLCLCACSARDDVSENSESMIPSSQGEESEPSSSDSSLSSSEESKKSEESEQNSAEQAVTSSISSDSLLEIANTEYLPLFGRLFNCEDWNDAEEIPVSMYYDWYREHINSTTTHEERIERYKLDSDPESLGWAYPAEEFEDYVQQHFTVSTEYLRGNDEIYLTDQEVYWIAGGGSNISYRTKVESDEDILADGEFLTIRVACSLIGDFSDTIYKILVIDTSGGKINFVSCKMV